MIPVNYPPIPPASNWTFRNPLNLVPLALLFAASAPNVHSSENALIVKESRLYTEPTTELTVVTGFLEAPGGVEWGIQPGSESGSNLHSVQLVPTAEDAQKIEALTSGRRYRKIEEGKRLDQRSDELRSLYYQVIYYARENGGKGPCDLKSLFPDEAEFPDWLRSDSIQLIPGVPMELSENNWPNPKTPQILAIETRPYISDGKHWIILNNGRTQRRDVDKDLLDKHNLEISPEFPETSLDERLAKLLEKQEKAQWIIRGLYNGSRPLLDAHWKAILISSNGQSIPIAWNPSGAVESDVETGKTDLAAWALARAEGWQDWIWESDAPALIYWLTRTKEIYGADASWISSFIRDNQRNNRPDFRVNALEVFGGRAAIRETLQTEVLTTANNNDSKSETTPIDQLPTVVVQSHPFEKMWQELDQEPLSGTLLDWAPQDQLSVYFKDVDLAARLVNKGAAYLQNLGSGFQNSSFHHHVIDKTMARLGLKQEWAELFMNPTIINEMLWLTGDLFFTEGADLTILISPKATPFLNPIRNLVLSRANSDGSGILRIQPLQGSGHAYWVIQDDLWILSTNEATVQEVLKLKNTNGAGGLGRSSEFQYLQNRLPISASTGAYVYFSDAFVRSVIGAEIKIAQWRRTRARAALEGVTYAAMMYEMDHQRPPTSIEVLKKSNYLDRNLDDSKIQWTPGGVPVHSEYGSLNAMTPVSAIQIDSATAEEAAAYSRYVENYSRYWSRFFDPIAIRFNREQPVNPESASAYSLETFILPLVENSLYNQVRSVLVSKEDSVPLRVPEFNETPVVKMTLNFQESQWVNWIRDFMYEGLSRFTGLPPELYDEFGPGITIALHDTDPILALGSGDVLGLLKNRVRGANNDMFMISSLLAIFTRPTTLAIELKDPEKAMEIMRRISKMNPQSRRDQEMQGRFYKVQGEDAWVFEWSFAGLVTLRFGVQIENGFLSIKNLPWDKAGDITGSRMASLNAVHLEAKPGAADLQLPSLFTAAMDSERNNALSGSVYLETIRLALGAESVEAAKEKHYELFGFHPFHPGVGQWTMSASGTVVSDRFGTASTATQPPYRSGFRNFGLLGSVTQLNLQTQLEEEGLRARFYWETVTAGSSD